MNWMPPPGWELLEEPLQQPEPAAPSGWKPPKGFEVVKPEIEDVYKTETDPLAKSVMEKSFPGIDKPDLTDFIGAVRKESKALGMIPEHYLTGLLYESPEIEQGNFWQAGPRTKWGQHRGMFQWGEPQASQYGVHEGMAPGDQLAAGSKYLFDRGFKPGMGLLDFYSTINAGAPGLYDRSDRPGETVQSHVDRMLAERLPRAQALLAQYPEQPETPSGLLEPGNLDYTQLPVWPEGKGFKTMKSASFNLDGKEYLLPTVDPETGKNMTQEQTLARFQETGQHLGIFDNSDDATAYSQRISEEQNARKPWQPPSGWEVVQAEAPEPEKPGFLDSVAKGVDQLQQMGYAAVEAGGELAGSEGMTQWGKEGREAEARELKNQPSSSLYDVKGAGDFAQWVKEIGGQQAPILGVSAAGTLAGAGIGSMIAPGPGTMVGGALGAFFPSFFMELGAIQTGAKEKDPQAVADAWTVAGGTFAGLLDSITPFKFGTGLLSKFGREAGEEIAESIWKRATKEGFKGATREGVTEAAQEVIEEYAAAKNTGTPMDWKSAALQAGEAGVAGSIIGGGIGAAQGAIPGKAKVEETEQDKLAPEALQDRIDAFIPPPGWEVVSPKTNEAEAAGTAPAPSVPTPESTPEGVATNNVGEKPNKVNLPQTEQEMARQDEALRLWEQSRNDRRGPPPGGAGGTHVQPGWDNLRKGLDEVAARDTAATDAVVSRETVTVDFGDNLPRFGKGPQEVRIVSQTPRFIGIEAEATGKRARVPVSLWQQIMHEPRRQAELHKSLSDLLASNPTDPDMIWNHPAMREEEFNQEWAEPKTHERLRFDQGTGKWTETANEPATRARREFDFDGEKVVGYRKATEKLAEGGRKFAGPKGVAKERHATLVIGGPGVGKSTIVEKKLAPLRRAAVVDADIAKTKMKKEYKGGRGAQAVHKESRKLAERQLSYHVERGENVVMTMTGQYAGGVQAFIARLREAGYSVDVVNVKTDELTTAKRIAKRFLETGRSVTRNYAKGAGNRAARTYMELRDAKAADRFAEIDTTADLTLTQDGEAVVDLEGLRDGRVRGDGRERLQDRPRSGARKARSARRLGRSRSGQDFKQFIASIGGVKDVGGNLKSMGMPIYQGVHGVINNKTGKDPDKVRELAVQAGFIRERPYEEEAQTTIDDLLDLFDRAFTQGEKIYAFGNEGVAEERKAREKQLDPRDELDHIIGQIEAIVPGFKVRPQEEERAARLFARGLDPYEIAERLSIEDAGGFQEGRDETNARRAKKDGKGDVQGRPQSAIQARKAAQGAGRGKKVPPPTESLAAGVKRQKDDAQAVIPGAEADEGEAWIQPSDESLAQEYKIKQAKNDYLVQQYPTEKAWIEAVRRGRVVEVPASLDAKIARRTHTKSQKALLDSMKGYASYPKFRNEKTLQGLYDRIKAGEPMDMPLIYVTEDGRMTVRAGNTRLDVAEQLGVTPKAILFGPGIDKEATLAAGVKKVTGPQAIWDKMEDGDLKKLTKAQAKVIGHGTAMDIPFEVWNYKMAEVVGWMLKYADKDEYVYGIYPPNYDVSGVLGKIDTHPTFQGTQLKLIDAVNAELGQTEPTEESEEDIIKSIEEVLAGVTPIETDGMSEEDFLDFAEKKEFEAGAALDAAILEVATELGLDASDTGILSDEVLAIEDQGFSPITIKKHLNSLGFNTISLGQAQKLHVAMTHPGQETLVKPEGLATYVSGWVDYWTQKHSLDSVNAELSEQLHYMANEWNKGVNIEPLVLSDALASVTHLPTGTVDQMTDGFLAGLKAYKQNQDDPDYQASVAPKGKVNTKAIEDAAHGVVAKANETAFKGSPLSELSNKWVTIALTKLLSTKAPKSEADVVNVYKNDGVDNPEWTGPMVPLTLEAYKRLGGQTEPTMEEILTSIKKIIGEDEAKDTTLSGADMAVANYPFVLSAGMTEFIQETYHQVAIGKLPADEEFLSGYMSGEGYGDGPAKAAAKTIVDTFNKQAGKEPESKSIWQNGQDLWPSIDEVVVAKAGNGDLIVISRIQSTGKNDFSFGYYEGGYTPGADNKWKHLGNRDTLDQAKGAALAGHLKATGSSATTAPQWALSEPVTDSITKWIDEYIAEYNHLVSDAAKAFAVKTMADLVAAKTYSDYDSIKQAFSDSGYYQELFDGVSFSQAADKVNDLINNPPAAATEESPSTHAWQQLKPSQHSGYGYHEGITVYHLHPNETTKPVAAVIDHGAPFGGGGAEATQWRWILFDPETGDHWTGVKGKSGWGTTLTDAMVQAAKAAGATADIDYAMDAEIEAAPTYASPEDHPDYQEVYDEIYEELLDEAQSEAQSDFYPQFNDGEMEAPDSDYLWERARERFMYGSDNELTEMLGALGYENITATAPDKQGVDPVKWEWTWDDEGVDDNGDAYAQGSLVSESIKKKLWDEVMDKAYEQEEESYYQDSDNPTTFKAYSSHPKVSDEYVSYTGYDGEWYWNGKNYSTDDEVKDAIWEKWWEDTISDIVSENVAEDAKEKAYEQIKEKIAEEGATLGAKPAPSPAQAAMQWKQITSGIGEDVTRYDWTDPQGNTWWITYHANKQSQEHFKDWLYGMEGMGEKLGNAFSLEEAKGKVLAAWQTKVYGKPAPKTYDQQVGTYNQQVTQHVKAWEAYKDAAASKYSLDHQKLQAVLIKAKDKFNNTSSSQAGGTPKWREGFMTGLNTAFPVTADVGGLTDQQKEDIINDTYNWLTVNKPPVAPTPPKPPPPPFKDQYADSAFARYKSDAAILKAKIEGGLDMSLEAREKRRIKGGWVTPAWKGAQKEGDYVVITGRQDSGSYDYNRGAFFSSKQSIASEWAGGGVIYPVWLRTAGWKVIDYHGASYSSHGGNDAQIKKARQEGYTGLWLKNVQDTGGTGDQLIAWNTSDIRSVHARFDEEDMFSGDILAAGVSRVRAELREDGFAKLKEIAKRMKEATAVVHRIAGPIEIVWREIIPANMVNLGATYQFDGDDTLGGYYTPAKSVGPKGLPADAVIGLAFGDKDFDPREIGGHEAFHHVERALANEDELAVMQDPREMARVRKLAEAEIGVEATAKQSDIEIRTYASQRWTRMKDAGLDPYTGEISTVYMRVWERIRQFLRRVRNVLRGLGYDSIEDIFEDARLGKFAARNPRAGFGVKGDLAASRARERNLGRKAIEHFGKTQEASEAGYIMPGGERLDFSGRHYSGDYEKAGEGSKTRNVLKPGRRDYGEFRGQRYVDHRELDELIPSGGTDGMVDFMGRAHAIRWQPGVGAEASFMPTEMQIRKIVYGFKSTAEPWSAGDPTSGIQLDLHDPRTGEALESGNVKPTLEAVTKWFKEATKKHDLYEEEPGPDETLAAGMKTIRGVMPGMPGFVQPPPKQPPEKWAGNINLDKIESSEDVPGLLKEMAEHYEGFMEARGGRISHARTRELAAMMGLDPSKLAKKRRNMPGLREAEMLAVRNAMVAGGNRIHDLAEKAKGGSDEDKVALLKARAQLGALAEYVAGETAYAGRLLNQFKIIAGQDKELMAALLDNQGQTLDQFIDRVLMLKDPTKVAAFSNRSLLTKTTDVIFELWINALLSGPVTQATNLFSNTLVAWVSVPETLISAAISKVTGSGIPFDAAFHQAMGVAYGYMDGAKAAITAAKTEEPTGLTGKVEARHPKAIPNKYGGRIWRLPGLGLLMGDELYKAVNYRGEIAKRAAMMATAEGLKGNARTKRIADLINNPTDRLMRYGRIAAERQTFTNKAGKVAQIAHRAVASIPGLRYVLPFIRTPANIVSFAIRRSPFGFAFQDVRDDIFGRNGPQARDEAIAKMVLGSAISITAFTWAASGLITGGGPDDPRERSLLYMLGWQPYSINIGGTYYSFARFEPLSTLLGVAADAYELQQAMSEEDQNNIAGLMIGSITRNLTNKTFLRGLSEVFEVTSDPKRYAYEWVKNFSGTLVPTGVAQIARANDPYLREARTITDNLKSRVPGLRETLRKRRDPHGEEIKKEGSWFFGVPGASYFSPIFKNAIKDNPAAKEMIRLGYAPGMPSRKINNVELTPEQYESYAIYAGRNTKEVVDKLMARENWDSLSDDQRLYRMKKMVNEAREAARAQVIRDFPDLKQQIMSKRRERRMVVDELEE